MPINIQIITTSELFASALDAAREMSVRILKLADLNVTPLAPGETADTRRHQIAKLGKAVAEAFLTIDNLIRMVTESHGQPSDVTAGPTNPPDNSDVN
jgi:hypothetical protein